MGSRPVGDDRDPSAVRIGANIRKVRRANGVTQAQLAAAIGITHQQIHKYKRGGSHVSAARLFIIASRLGVTVEALFTGVGATGALDAQGAASPPR